MSHAPKFFLRILFSSSLFALAITAHAQDSATGVLRGVVFDPSGSRIAQATIVVVNAATGVRHSADSDAEGRFALELLPPGDYTARATAAGMSPQLSPQLHIDVGGDAELEFHLAIAGAQENVTVSGAPQLVETKPSAVSSLLDERAIGDFPLNGRRFSDLALFSPGVTQDPRSLTSSTQWRSLLRRYSRLPEQLAGRRRRLQQRLLRPGTRTLSRTLPVFYRHRAGVPRLFQLVRPRTRSRRRRRHQRRHQVGLQPPARHDFLLLPRQFLGRGRCLSRL